MAKIVNNRAASCDESAERCQRLRERTHHKIDIRIERKVRRRAASALSYDAESVRIIDHNRRPVFLRKAAYGRQVGEVSADGKHAVDYDKASRAIRHRCEPPLKGIHVVVTEAQRFAEGHLRGTIYARVGFRVKYNVVAASNKRADHAEVRLEAGAENYGVLLADKVRKFTFKLDM